MNQHIQFPSRITLPGPSPVEEIVRWRGAPNWRAAALHVWRLRAAAVYFAALLADGVGRSLGSTPAAALARQGELALLLIALGSLALLTLLAWLTERTTSYTITDTHVMLKYGVALRATLVIPFGAIEHLAVRVNADHTGDLALRLRAGQRVMYPKLWPHVRPWTWLRAEPMLRCVPEAGAVGALLARGVGASADMRRRLEADHGEADRGEADLGEAAATLEFAQQPSYSGG